jgi:hypothetical protein
MTSDRRPASDAFPYGFRRGHLVVEADSLFSRRPQPWVIKPVLSKVHPGREGVRGGSFKVRRRRLQFVPGPATSEAVQRRQLPICEELLKMNSTDAIEL